MCDIPNLDLVNINAYTKFGEILSIGLKILSGNENLTDRRTEWRTTQIQYRPRFENTKNRVYRSWN